MYRKPVHNLIQARVEVLLVDAQHIKAVPGSEMIKVAELDCVFRVQVGRDFAEISKTGELPRHRPGREPTSEAFAHLELLLSAGPADPRSPLSKRRAASRPWAGGPRMIDG